MLTWALRKRGEGRVLPGAASLPYRSIGLFEKNFQEFWKIPNLSGTDAATVQWVASSAMRQTRELSKSSCAKPRYRPAISMDCKWRKAW